MIAINKIVNVNFDIKQAQTQISSYNTTVFITNCQLKQDNSVTEVLCESIEDVIKVAPTTTGGDGTAYTDDGKKLISDAKLYFENGGKKLLISKSSLTSEDKDGSAFKELIARVRTFIATNNEENGIEDRFIWVVIDKDLIGTNKLELSELQKIVDYVESLAAPYSIRLALTTNEFSLNSTSPKNFVKQTNFDITNRSVAVKYVKYDSTATNPSKTYYNEALMIGAYYSQIELTEVETIKDYCFTEEINTVSGNKGINNITSEEFDALKENYNFIELLGNKVMNFGGNLSNGISISIDFATICAENDIATGVTNVIASKQYLTDAGLTNVVDEISRQLQKYKTNGYLKVSSQYSGETISRTYNGRIYKIIENRKSLPQGFYIFTIPMAYIDSEDKKAKRFTPIYVIMETQAGARFVEIKGDIRA